MNGPTTHIHSQGLTADIDLTRPGMEIYGGEQKGSAHYLFDIKGNLISNQSFGTLAPVAVWWTDKMHKLIVGNEKLFEFNGPALGEIKGKVIGVADCPGDWREELLVSVAGELHLYSTTIPATTRRVCLLQDRRYRTAVATQTMGYLYPPLPGLRPGRLQP